MSRKRCIYGWGVSIEEEGQSQQAGQCLLSRFLGPFKWHSSESTGEKGLYLYIGISVFFLSSSGGLLSWRKERFAERSLSGCCIPSFNMLFSLSGRLCQKDGFTFSAAFWTIGGVAQGPSAFNAARPDVGKDNTREGGGAICKWGVGPCTFFCVLSPSSSCPILSAVKVYPFFFISLLSCCPLWSGPNIQIDCSSYFSARHTTGCIHRKA